MRKVYFFIVSLCLFVVLVMLLHYWFSFLYMPSIAQWFYHSQIADPAKDHDLNYCIEATQLIDYKYKIRVSCHSTYYNNPKIYDILTDPKYGFNAVRYQRFPNYRDATYLGGVWLQNYSGDIVEISPTSVLARPTRTIQDLFPPSYEALVVSKNPWDGNHAAPDGVKLYSNSIESVVNFIPLLSSFCDEKITFSQMKGVDSTFHVKSLSSKKVIQSVENILINSGESKVGLVIAPLFRSKDIQFFQNKILSSCLKVNSIKIGNLQIAYSNYDMKLLHCSEQIKKNQKLKRNDAAFFLNPFYFDSTPISLFDLDEPKKVKERFEDEDIFPGILWPDFYHFITIDQPKECSFKSDFINSYEK